MTAIVPVVKKKSSLISLLVKLMVLAAVMATGVFAWSMLFGAKSLEDDLAFLPQQTNVILRVDMQRFVTSSFARELRPLIDEQISNAPKNADLPNDVLKDLVLEIDTFTLGIRVDDPKKPDANELAGVIRFRSEQLLDNFLPAKVAANASYEQTQDGKTIVVIDDGAICQIDARTLAVGKPSTLREVLGRHGEAASFSPEMQATLDAADFAKVLTVIATVPPNAPQQTQPAAFMMGPDLAALKGFIIDADADAELQLGAKLVMATEAAAEEWSQMIDMFATSLKQRSGPHVQIPDDVFEHSTSGTTISIAMKVPQKIIREGIESQKRARPLLAESRPTEEELACKKDISELSTGVERYRFDMGKYPLNLNELARHDTTKAWPRYCQAHDALYQLDPHTGRITERPKAGAVDASRGGAQAPTTRSATHDTVTHRSAAAHRPASTTARPRGGIFGKAAVATCAQTIAELNSALERYYFDIGEWPVSIDDLAAHSQQDLRRSCRQHGADYAIDPKTHRIIEHSTASFAGGHVSRNIAASRPTKQQQGAAVCRQNTAELNSLIERFYFDEGKFPTAITQLVKPATIVPTFCRAHNARYAIDPKTHRVIEHRVIEHSSTAPHAEQPRAGSNHPLAMREPPSGRLKNSAEAQRVLRDTLGVAGYAGEYLIYSEAERDDTYTFALLVPPFYFGHDSPLLIGVRKEPPYVLTAYALTDGNGTHGWATQGREVFEILQPRRKITIRESYATPEELFNAFKASATEGDFERYSQVFAGQGKENHATLERMQELGKAFARINYQGFESLAADKVPSLLEANGKDRMSTSELEFGYLLIGPDKSTGQRLRAARLVNGWRITQD